MPQAADRHLVLTTSPDPKGVLSLAKLEQLLAELGALGQIMMQAIESDDDARLLAGMQAARGLRARLSAGTSLAKAEAGSLEEVARLRHLLSAAQLTERIADRWLGRALPPDRELLAAPGGELFLADAILPAVWDAERDLVILVGPGVSPVASALRQLRQARILWYAPDQEEPAGDGAALRVEDDDELVVAVRGFGSELPERVVVRALDPAQRELCARADELFREARHETLIHRNTVVTFNRTWLEQGLSNLGALCSWPSVAALDGELAGLPLVIIAPGPSLARNVDLLTQLKGKAVLLAVSHALTALSRAGIAPDFVLAVDPQDVRYHYAGNPLDQVAAVINGATVHPELFSVGAPSYLWLSANGQLDRWLGDLAGEQPQVSGGGSVATSAFNLAVRWGCDPIAVVGLDLSFPGGKYYVDTSCDGGARAVLSGDGRTVAVEGWSEDFHRMKASSRAARRTERVVELPGWHGDPVASSFMFAMFHRWFEERLRSLAGAAEVFNCTEGGARIEGMKHVPLAAFAERVASYAVDPRAMVSRAVAALQPAERASAAARRLDELGSALRRCRSLAGRCARMAERHIRTGNGGGLARAEKALLEQLGSLQLLSMMAQREIGDALASARDLASVAEAVDRSAQIFAVIDQVASWLAPRVLAARGALFRPRGATSSQVGAGSADSSASATRRAP